MGITLRTLTRSPSALTGVTASEPGVGRDGAARAEVDPDALAARVPPLQEGVPPDRVEARRAHQLPAGGRRPPPPVRRDAQGGRLAQAGRHARPLAPLGEGQVHGLFRAAGEAEAGVRQVLRGRHLEEGIPPHRTHRVSRAVEMNSADPVILSKLVYSYPPALVLAFSAKLWSI